VRAAVARGARGLRGAAALAACVLLVSCAPLRPSRDASLAARVDAALARRGLGSDALSVIDNIVRHETMPPPAAPALVRELLTRPLAAADAPAVFDRAVPEALRRLVAEAAAAPRPAPDGPPLQIRDLLGPYLDELAEAQRLLRSAAREGALDAQAVIRDLDVTLPALERWRGLAASFDPARLEAATAKFVTATARFVAALRAAGPDLQFPGRALRFDSPVGAVSIGTRGDDVHAADAAVIVDPGGHDTYERAPVVGGAVSVIVDLAGDDRYRGSDVVVHGLSALVDLAGHDRYAMAGPGIGAAIAGASLVLDFEGDDTYEAGVFGQGAAAFGLGALVDLRGDDTYRLRAAGQGFGLPGGLGLLWDRGGNDAYVASGLPDPFGRGGGLSLAQGAGNGVRTALGGGLGILRDDAGDDTYTAELFAQGVGYYHGLGLLWDGGGADRYAAVRYAQGNGVHEAVGVLRDEWGNDRYELAGVGQGMGLDLAVGMLLDGAGDDLYVAQFLAQGAATANGLGLLVDAGGTDRWLMGADRRGWGRAEWLRGLPSLGVLLYDPDRASFEREGQGISPPADSPALGGPLGGSPVVHEAAATPVCPTVAVTVAGSPTPPLAEALRRIMPAWTGGDLDAAAYAEVKRRLTAGVAASLAELPPDDFEVGWSLAEALRCVLTSASESAAAGIWTEIEAMLEADPPSPFAEALAVALRARPAPPLQLRRIVEALERHPRCALRTAALRIRQASLDPDAAPARAALRSSCWRLQAAALDVLKRIGLEPEAADALPSFLRSHAHITS
jgi:hypothetical protein